MKWKRARNEINGVVENNLSCDNKEVVKDKVIYFFKAKFERSFGPQVRLDNICFNSISGEDNDFLVGVVSKEKVKAAVWSCDSLKSPSPNDFNFNFIKFCWDCLKEDVLSVVNDLVSKGIWPRGQKLLLFV